MSIHRIMAEVFLPNPEGKLQVNHKDGNKLNNRLDNLEWNTPEENSQHAYDTGLSSIAHCEIEVHQYYLSGKYKASYRSLHDAARTLDTSPSTICNALKHKCATAYSSLWDYERKEEIPAYTGSPIADYYLLDGKIIKTSKELCEVTGFTRPLLHRRFHKYGNKFVEKGMSVERILCT
jgi:hypothetical protein